MKQVEKTVSEASC